MRWTLMRSACCRCNHPLRHVIPRNILASRRITWLQNSFQTAICTAAAAAESTSNHLAQKTAQPINSTGHQHGSYVLPTLASEVVKSAYIHLPFCKRRCYYCDFPVSVVGSTDSPSPGMQRYIDLLKIEISGTRSTSQQPLETVFFGGGTPSLIPPQLLSEVLQVLRDKFGISPTAEISMEADPGTFTVQRLQHYMHLGVNRFSIGVQSFQEELLKACGRSHNLADVHQALQYVQQAEVPNWSLDLISGLPHLTMDMWADSLRQAAAWDPDHISVYDLQVEEKTPFARWYTPGAGPMPTDEAAADMFRLASSQLRAAGYEHYEISSYGKPGRRCAHNLGYWHGHAFHGFGLGATSHIGHMRFARPRKMAAYQQWVEQMEEGSSLAAAIPEEASEQLLDTVMLRLRMSDGLDLDSLAKQYGPDASMAVAASLRPHLAAGLVKYHGMAAGVQGSVRLADPEGFLMSNDIISDVFLALDGVMLAEHIALPEAGITRA